MILTSAGDNKTSENTNLQSAILKSLTKSSSGETTRGLRGRGCARVTCAMGEGAAVGVGAGACCECEGAGCEITGVALLVGASILPLGTRVSALLGGCCTDLAAQPACEGNAGRSAVGL